MTFDKSKWAQADVGYAFTVPQLFSYYNEADSLTVIQGSGYFNSITGILKQYDLIFAIGTNGYAGIFQVSSATGATTVTVRFYNQVTHHVGKKGTLTTVGGSATESFTIAGIVAGEVVVTQMENNGTNNVTILEAEITALNTLELVFSGDPGNDAIFNYVTVSDFI